jgi:hypothetical protein
MKQKQIEEKKVQNMEEKEKVEETSLMMKKLA